MSAMGYTAGFMLRKRSTQKSELNAVHDWCLSRSTFSVEFFSEDLISQGNLTDIKSISLSVYYLKITEKNGFFASVYLT